MTDNKAPSNMVRVLFIDNDMLVQLGAKTLLGRQPGWVVHSTDNCATAIDHARSFKPNIILFSIDEATGQSLRNIHMLKCLGIPIVVYGPTTALDDLYKLLAAGADTFLHQSVSHDVLINTINECIQGRRAIITGNENNLLYDVLQATDRPVHEYHPLLTRREKDVLACIQQGMSNAEIASHLNITPGTVKVHISHLFRKYGVACRTRLAIRAACYPGGNQISSQRSQEGLHTS